jgi:hypothetical protein
MTKPARSMASKALASFPTPAIQLNGSARPILCLHAERRGPLICWHPCALFEGTRL